MAARTIAPQPRKTAPAASTKPARKPATIPAASFVAPTESVAVEPARTVNGLRVIDDQPYQDAAGRRQTRFRALTLAGGTTTVGCADCIKAGAFLDVLHHRQDVHGDRRTGRRAGTAPTPAPTANILGMTVGELMNLASQIEAWEATTDRLTAERDRAIARATEAETELKALKKQLGKAAALLGGGKS